MSVPEIMVAIDKRKMTGSDRKKSQR